jgi:hypothetical protein
MLADLVQANRAIDSGSILLGLDRIEIVAVL